MIPSLTVDSPLDSSFVNHLSSILRRTLRSTCFLLTARCGRTACSCVVYRYKTDLRSIVENLKYLPHGVTAEELNGLMGKAFIHSYIFKGHFPLMVLGV